MKKFCVLISILLMNIFAPHINGVAPVDNVRTVFSENALFGLKNSTGEIIVKPQYKKLIRIGNNSWIGQNKRLKFGLISNDGEVLVPFRYRHTDRILGKYAKFGNDNDYGIYDEFGEIIVPPIYSGIELLYGKMFLTYKNYKYGVCDFEGNLLLANLYEDIYMPKPNIMRILYHGQWIEIENVTSNSLTLPTDMTDLKTDGDFKVTDLMINTGVVSGYSVLTASDYILKLISSISPAHEGAIDELMLSHGADTVNILVKMGWLPKYPITFAKHYYRNIRIPNNGPLSDLRYDLINQMK